MVRTIVLSPQLILRVSLIMLIMDNSTKHQTRTRGKPHQHDTQSASTPMYILIESLNVIVVNHLYSTSTSYHNSAIISQKADNLAMPRPQPPRHAAVSDGGGQSVQECSVVFAPETIAAEEISLEHRWYRSASVPPEVPEGPRWVLVGRGHRLVVGQELVHHLQAHGVGLDVGCELGGECPDVMLVTNLEVLGEA